MTPGHRKLILLASVLLVLLVAGTLLLQEIPATASAPLFVLVVIVEVVIAPIPGGAIGYLGAARFGFWQAWPLLYIGNIMGTTLVFFLARRIGGPLFEENVSQRARNRYNHVIDNHPVLLWLAYSVPLIPVDVLSVLAGLSRISARRFLMTAYTGYVIYTGIVAFVGSFLATFVGVMEAMSVLGVIILVGIAAWLWRELNAGRVPRNGEAPAKGDAGDVARPDTGTSPREVEPRVRRIALTGNIASGKSAVADVWHRLGAVVIDADELARRAVEPGSPALTRVRQRFGEAVITAEGALDRAALRRVVFTDPAARDELEAIVHPEVARLRAAEDRRLASMGVRSVVHMIPLLFEVGLEHEFDRVVLVDAPREVRLQRLTQSRGLDTQEAVRMMDAQMPAAEKRRRAHVIIDNDGPLEQLERRAEEVWREIERQSG